MGTQQLLLLALGVIIIGIAVAVGLTMFVNQSYNSNKQYLVSEMNTFPPSVMRYWTTSKLLGGAGGDINDFTIDRLAAYMGWSGANYSHSSDNGEFRIISINDSIITLKGLGVQTKGSRHPLVTTTIDLTNGRVVSVLSDATGF